MNANYEIGGISCKMTYDQAASWNAGDLTAEKLAGATIHLPSAMTDGNGRVFPIWDFIETIHPEIYEAQMKGMPANRVR